MRKLYVVLIVIAIIVLSTALVIAIKKIIYASNYNKKINAILSDDVEIEKKWLINKDNIPYNLSTAEKIIIAQTYINFSPEIRVRKINNGEKYTFAVKLNMTKDGMMRDEMETNISEEEYNDLIQKKEGHTINKTRYQFLEGGNVFAIDVFSGELEGLAYLEVEFANKEEADNFTEPSWVIKDVTVDLNYKNGYLARYGIPKE